MKILKKQFMKGITCMMAIVMGLCMAPDTGAGGKVQAADCDLSFGTADSILGFDAGDGAVSWGDGKMLYTVGSRDPALTSPVIDVPAGHPYSMLLPLRNTILFRAQNATNAAAWRISVKTSAQKDFTDSNVVTIPVTPDCSSFETYYVNLSTLDLSGYLRGFRLEPIAGDGSAVTGTIEIEAISFEREDPIIETAGEILSCIADPEQDTVTVTGRLQEAYRGKEVILYETDISNLTDAITGKIVGKTTAEGADFTVTFPLYARVGKETRITRLSSLFIAVVDGVKVTQKAFPIENYRDFDENPYAFSVPTRKAVVTDAAYGAAGDGYTDDTAAIQKAIDAMAEAGGGTVVLPGDPADFYGRRYIVTNVKMKSNIELVIEKGAILWQSPRREDYTYDVVYGHDIVIEGINWTHAFLCHNLPLVQGDHADNIRITGGGAIRAMDWGGEDPTGYDGAKLWTGCAHKIHAEPVGLYACTNVEVSDLTFLRSNGYHFSLQSCKNVYAANLTFRQVACASGDGISMFAGTKNVFITRLMMISNDDAVVLVSAYNDPRGLTWWRSNPEGDNSIVNITVCHSWIYSGHGVTFITWGTDNPDLSRNLIKDIYVYDNVLNQVGTWCDNPYYGEVPFTNLETDDYSPVQGVRIFNNKIETVDLMTIQATDLVTDTALHSAEQFQFGDFERRDSKNPDWVSGLANWTVRENGGTAKAVVNDAGYMGLAEGKVMLAQGLYMARGGHRFTADIRVVSGTARLFVSDILTGEIFTSKEYTAADFDGGWKQVSLTFAGVNRNLYLGVEVLSEDGAVNIDNCSVTDIAESEVRPDTAQEMEIESLTARVDREAAVAAKRRDTLRIAVPIAAAAGAAGAIAGIVAAVIRKKRKKR